MRIVSLFLGYKSRFAGSRALYWYNMGLSGGCGSKVNKDINIYLNLMIHLRIYPIFLVHFVPLQYSAPMKMKSVSFYLFSRMVMKANLL